MAAVLFAGSMMAADVLNADFTKGQGDWTINDVELDGITYVWKAAGNYGMKASAYVSKTAHATESWLISPVFDLSAATSATLTINHAVNQGAPTAFSVKGWNGESWVDLYLSAWPAGNSWNFESATADLTALLGIAQAKVAFVYVSSADVCPTWEIKTAVVSAEEAIGGPVFYLVGTKIGWEPKDEFKLSKNPGADGEWMIEYTAEAEEGLKVLGIEGASQVWYKDGMDNEYRIEEAGDYTIYFRPDGNPDWSYTYFTAVMKEKPLPISCADVYSLEKGAEIDLNPVTVTYAKDKSVYVKDEKGSMLLFLPAAGAASWKAGDVLTGVVGTLDIYNGLYEVKVTTEQIAAVSVEAGEAPAPEELAAIPGDADINKFVIMKGVSVEAGEFTDASVTNLNASLGDGTFVLRNNFKFVQAFEEGKTYNIIGVVAVYEKSGTRTIQLFLISAEEVVDNSGYFVVGNFTGWGVDPAYKLAANPEAENELMIKLSLTTESQFKVVYSADGAGAYVWFPEGMGNNYGENGEITEDGDYIVYFRPNGDGGEDWFYRYIYVVKDPGDGIENIVLTEKAQKVLVDGVVYIIRDNKLFNLQGAQVR